MMLAGRGLPPGPSPSQQYSQQHQYIPELGAAGPSRQAGYSHSSSSASSSPSGAGSNVAGAMLPPVVPTMNMPSATHSPPQTATGAPALDPPFRGYIESTLDALLVFEAARRGMVPRVTRRLIERERGMVQSGAVFVFDEHESGIKRWTDGLIWSPSRILGNFLVYRETGKRGAAGAAGSGTATPGPGNTTGPSPVMSNGYQFDEGNSRSQGRPGLSAAAMAGLDHFAQTQQGGGDLNRPRSSSDGAQDGMDKNKERQLVGSLVNSYKFKDGGLVKKTMSVNVGGFAQHLISYYSVEDVVAGRLRTPSSIPELQNLDIAPEYLHKQNFRFPPVIEIGPDGVPRYRGEPEDQSSQQYGGNTSGSDMTTYTQQAPPPNFAQYDGPEVKYEVAWPGDQQQQSYAGPAPMPSGSESQQHGFRHVSQPESQPAAPYGSSYDAATGLRSPQYAHMGNQWYTPSGLGPARGGAPPMLRHASEGGLMLSRQNRRHTPYGPSPTTTTFAAAGQGQPSRRRTSNASSRPPSSRMPDPNALGQGQSQLSAATFDYSGSAPAAYSGHDVQGMHLPSAMHQSQQHFGDPSGGNFVPGLQYSDGGMDNLSTANPSPIPSPLQNNFARSPVDAYHSGNSAWPQQQASLEPPRPATAGPGMLDGGHTQMMQRNRSSSGHGHYPNSLPAQADSSRSLGADLVVGIGGTGQAGGVAMSHSLSQPGPMRDMGAYSGVSEVILPAGQHFDWPVKSEGADPNISSSYDLMAQYGGGAYGADGQH